MKVVSITGRFLRRVQAQQFEPQEAEISITLATDDDEKIDAADAQPVMEKALKQAKTAVLNTLISGLKESAAPVVRPTTAPVVNNTTVVTPPADPAPKPEKPEKPEKPTSKKETKPKAAEATSADIPDGTPHARPEKPPRAEAADIPTVQAKVVDAPKKGDMTPTELSGWIAENIKAKKLTTADMRDVMGEYKIIRLGELTPPQVLEFQVKLQKVIADRKEA